MINNKLRVGNVFWATGVVLTVVAWPAFSSGRVHIIPTAPCGLAACTGAEAVHSNPPDQIFAQLTPTPGRDAASLDGWRLVRTPGPDKTDVVSIMRTADMMASDAEFAGMMIRCRQKSGLQIAFAVITPFHPRARPKITIGFNRSDMPFQAEVLPPGSLIALPNEAEVLAKGPWQSARELTVDIEDDGAKIHGVVSLENLTEAIARLQASCP